MAIMPWRRRPKAARARGLLAAALLIAAYCSTALAFELPSWVRTPPQDTAASMFGVGEGPTLSESTQQALRSIAGKLSTHIKSDAVSRGGVSGEIATRHYHETVEAYVQDIKLSAYEVRQAELVGGRYFVLVEMSRTDFVRDTRLRLDEVDAELHRRLDAQTAARPFDRFLACQAAPVAIEQGRLLTLILSTADPEFAAAPQLQRYDAYQQGCAQALQGVTLRLDTEPRFAQLAEAIGRKLTVRTVSGGYADGWLQVNGNVTNREIFGSKNAAVDLTVALLDDRNAVVARHSYRLSGVSVASFDAALEDALRKFLAAGGDSQVLTDLGFR